MIDYSQVKILRENKVYRMSDVVMGYGPRHQIDRETILAEPQYRETILHDYLVKCPSTCDKQVFVDVVQQHTQRYNQANPNDLVMHVRLGDVMQPELAETKQEIRCKSIYHTYAQLFYKHGQWIRQHGRVTIVTALHFGANELNGKYYYTEEAEHNSFETLRRLVEVFESWDMKVSIQSSLNVDEDFCFMASSQQFVGSTSKFAELVSWCLKDSATCHLM